MEILTYTPQDDKITIIELSKEQLEILLEIIKQNKIIIEGILQAPLLVENTKEEE